jgi:hypothetical protein
MYNTISIVVEASSQNIIRCFLSLSAIIPPTGDIISSGMYDNPNTKPNNDDEPLISNMYKGKANVRIILPNIDIICPKISREKSLFQKLRVATAVLFIMPTPLPI